MQLEGRFGFRAARFRFLQDVSLSLQNATAQRGGLLKIALSA
jgi:hypothetical protein